MPFYAVRGPAPADEVPDMDEEEMQELLAWFRDYQAAEHTIEQEQEAAVQVSACVWQLACCEACCCHLQVKCAAPLAL